MTSSTEVTMTESRLVRRLMQDMASSMERRHDFAVRKMTFCTALLGLGALFIKVGKDETLMATPLLYAVPLVAIAFDVYIATEDFRIKRIGEFIRRPSSPSHPDERVWEEFVKATPNWFKPYAFFLPTLLLVIASGLLLHVIGNQRRLLLLLWSAFVLLIQGILVLAVLVQRKALREKHGADAGVE